MRKIALLAVLALSVTPLFAHKLVSPSGKLAIEVKLQKQQLVYTVSYAGKTLVEPSALGFDMAEGYFGKDVRSTDTHPLVSPAGEDT